MTVTCPKCGDPHLTGLEPAGARSVPCPSCRTAVEVVAFGREAGAGRAGGGAAMHAVDGDAGCFFCEGFKATDVCSSCGRFICGRCRVDWAGRTVCMTCVHAQREVRGDDGFQSRRTIYDNLALSVLVWPLVLVPFYGLFFTAMAAPVTMFWVVRHWNSPRGIIPRGRFRLVAAGVISVVFIAGVLVGLGALISMLGNLGES